MPYLHLLLFALTALSVSHANHIKKGMVHSEGMVESPSGPMHFLSDADVKMPIVSWDELLADGVKVTSCDRKTTVFSGVVDQSDFEKGVVLVYPRDEYVDLGCPLPPKGLDSLIDVDEYIFRIVKRASFNGDVATVVSKFISGAEVIPTVSFDIVEMEDTVRVFDHPEPVTWPNETLSTAGHYSVTGGFSKKGGLALSRRTGPVTVEGSLKYNINTRVSIQRFVFDRRTISARFMVNFYAFAQATVSAAGSVTFTKDGDIFKVPVPNAGFVMNIPFLGKTSGGIVVGLGYELEATFGVEGEAEFTGAYTRSYDCMAKIGGSRCRRAFTGPSGPTVAKAGTSFGTEYSIEAELSGFAGVRPYVEVGINLASLGKLTFDSGATVGLLATISARLPPYKPFTGDRKIGTCSSCHFVQGNLYVEGRDFSVKLTVIKSTLTLPIVDKIFSFRIGTLCLAKATCDSKEVAPPSASPTPSPTPTPSVTPTQTPTPSPTPRPKCPCACIPIRGIADHHCRVAGRNGLNCRVSTCAFGFLQRGYECCS